MSAAASYTYAILRYFHDIATGECVNVGVALFAPSVPFLGIRCTTSAARTAGMFPDLNAEAFLAALRTIEDRFAALSQSSIEQQSRPTERNISELARAVLPEDDSSLKWASIGSGLTSDPEKELERLFERMVRRYEALPTADQSCLWANADPFQLFAVHKTATGLLTQHQEMETTILPTGVSTAALVLSGAATALSLAQCAGYSEAAVGGAYLYSPSLCSPSLPGIVIIGDQDVPHGLLESYPGGNRANSQQITIQAKASRK